MKERVRDILIGLAQGENRRKELLEATGIPKPSLDRWLRKLTDRRWIEKENRGYYLLTETGKEKYSELERPPVLLEPSEQRRRLKELIDLFPTFEHRSAFELAVSAIYAKQHLFSTFQKGWPGLILTGPTKTFKTGLAEAVVKSFGLKIPKVKKHLQTATPGELGFRRYQSGKGWEVEESGYFDRRVVVLDEADKASGKLSRALNFYLQSTRQVTVEGKTIALNPVPLVTLNADLADSPIPDPFIRRSLLLDTSKLSGLEEVDLQARKIFNHLQEPVFNLANPGGEIDGELPEKHLMALRDLYKDCLRTDYWNERTDLQPLWILVHGRRLSPLSEGETLSDTLLAVAYQVLSLDRLAGGTVNGWFEKLSEEAKSLEAEKFLEAVEKRKKLNQELEETKRKQKDRKLEAEEDRAEVAGRKTEEKIRVRKFLGRVRDFADQFNYTGSRSLNREIKGIREGLREFAARAKKSISSPEELEEWKEKYRELRQKEEIRGALAKMGKINLLPESEQGKYRSLSSREKKLLDKIEHYRKIEESQPLEDPAAKLKDMGAIKLACKIERGAQPESWVGSLREGVTQFLSSSLPPGIYEGVNGKLYLPSAFTPGHTVPEGIEGHLGWWNSDEVQNLLDDFEETIRAREFDPDWSPNYSLEEILTFGFSRTLIEPPDLEE